MTVVERAPVDATRVQQLTAVQALPRIFVAQHARDAAAGLRTAGFVSGYQGSPLGGVDAAFARDRDVAAADVRFLAGLNEELAATAVWGTQTPLRDRKRRVDGVVGMWFGKAPGLDRACDAIRHGNNLGADPRGGVLLAVGDDPAAKSSTLPCASEKTLAALHVPVLFPGNGADIVALGEYGIALSRATGFWVALKIVTDVADGLWEVPDVDAARPVISAPAFEWNGSPWRHQQRPLASMPHAGRAEGDIAGPRRAALEQFLAANPIDVVEVDPHDASMAIVAAGKTFHDTAQALADLGLGRAELERNGIRLLNVSLPWPLQAAPLLEATRGVDTVVVVEEKLPFIETQARDLLYRSPHRPSVVGERDHEGRALVPCDGELTASRISAALRRVLAGRVDLPPVQPERVRIPVITTERQAFFCSGCPHNRSTTVPDGSLVGAGIGCHGMAARMPHVNQQITGITHMGGEGAQWIGQSEYFDVDHIFQNVGDGTYFHSAQLAVQACVASGVNITFKLLFNGAVAMTGGQDVLGARSVPDLTHKLKAEGVTRIVVLTDELHRYGRRSGVAPGTDVWDRSRLEQAQLELRETPGVTVLVYDQQCAAEARRLRKRGLQPTRPERVVINERICEGCGDCGVKSNCLSVEPVDTEFGRKTRIAQDSCNEDYSCLDGDCPSFMMVEVDGARPASSTAAPPPVPDPVIPTIDGTYNVLLAGIGGTGIVTVNRILAAAAERDGLRAHGLDQTGLSQKAGPVTSHLRLETSSTGAANRLSPNSTDCFLGFDVLVAAGDVCADYLSTERTHAFVSTSKVPTGEMVRDPSVSFPPLPDLQAAVAPKVTDVVWLDILAAAETLCGSTQTANLMLVGAAVQAGALPISPSAIEAAIEQNGVAVDANRLAFTWGRVAIADPVAFAAASAPATTALDRSAAVGEAMIGQASGLTGELRRLAALRAGELVAFGNRRVARRYLDTVEAAATAEATLGEGREYATAVARSLHHVIAVKDEYEVARLMTDADVLAELDRQYPDAKSVHLLLHPPVLRSLGRQKKIRVSRRLFPAFKVLAAGKRLRGTPLDVFGLTRVRRLERTVRDEHWALVERLTATLDAANHADAVAAASAADVIRGYEDIKVRNVARYHEILENLGVRQPVAIAGAQTDHTVGSPTPSPESPRPRP